MKSKVIVYLVIIFFFIPLIVVNGQEQAKKLRDLSPDRPHQTESPITVDKWHVMIEADAINLTSKEIQNDQLNTLGFGLANVKFGFHDRMDIEIISGIYSRDIYKHQTLPDKNNFIPDLLFRYKLNLIGNDSGDFAIAIMPTLKTTNFFQQKLEIIDVGFLVNMEKELKRDIGLGYTGGLNSFSFDSFKKEYELFSTVSVDYKVRGALRNFVEFSYRYNQYAEYWNVYSFDYGFTFTPANNLQFDCGSYFFLPAKSPFFFIGGTIRI